MATFYAVGMADWRVVGKIDELMYPVGIDLWSELFNVLDVFVAMPRMDVWMGQALQYIDRLTQRICGLGWSNVGQSIF